MEYLCVMCDVIVKCYVVVLVVMVCEYVLFDGEYVRFDCECVFGDVIEIWVVYVVFVGFYDYGVVVGC